MKPQRQLIEHDPDTGQYGDCYRTCIAAILDMDAAAVPHFCDYVDGEGAPKLGDPDHYMTRANAWLGERGLADFTIAYDGSADLNDVLRWTSGGAPTVPMILCGTSSVGCNHVVVVLNCEIVCDPSGNGIVGPTSHGTWEVTCLAAIRGRPADAPAD